MNIKNKINNMDDARREKLGEVIRFGIVGGLATVLQYVILSGYDAGAEPFHSTNG